MQTTGRDALAAVAAVAVGVVLIGIGLVGTGDTATVLGWVPADHTVWWHLGPLAVGGAAMVVKRRLPLVMWLVGTVALAADFALGGGIAIVLVWSDLLYAVGLYAGRRTRAAVAVALGVATFVLALLAAERDRDLASFLRVGLQVGAVAFLPLWWAGGVRAGHDLAAAADERARLQADRADALTRLASADRAQALRAERQAMARDLHDVVSSNLSAIAIHSGAALSATPDVDRDRAALAQVRTASLASLAEMRTMIALLRSDEPGEGLATRAGLASLPELVDWARGAGLHVTTAPGPLQTAPLPTAVDQSALRIIQEALTNALKHGAGEVALTVDIDDAAVHVEVRNPLPSTPSTPSTPSVAPGGGAGLVSMRERAHALDGRLESGVDDGSWVVRADLPVARGAGR